MTPPTLDPQLLYLFLFGPGRGEGTIIRVPGDTWIVIDSCHYPWGSPALRLLKQHQATWSCVVLTHRHEDHYRHFHELLATRGSGPVGCADPHVDKWEDVATSPDAHRQVLHGELEQVISAIVSRWESEPKSKWLTYGSTERKVGQARLLSLHPERDFVRTYTGRDWNELSSALLLEWEGMRLLFGADVVNPHWRAIYAAYPEALDHQVHKVPHHGSLEAVYDGFGVFNLFPLWIVTPFSSKKVPSPQDGQGLHRLLQSVSEIHLTGLPEAHSRQADHPCETTRIEWRDGRNPVPLTLDLASGDHLTFDPPIDEDYSCCIVAGFDRNGTRKVLWHGPGTVRLKEC